MNKLNLQNDSKNQFRFKKEFQNILNIFFKLMKYKNPIEVDVLITTNENIKSISKEYRNIDKETDVLSFPFGDDKMANQLNPIPLGEIILSFEKVKNQAKEFNHSLKREFCFLFAHGLVHLSGRDHKKSVEEEKEFNSIVYNVMHLANIKR